MVNHTRRLVASGLLVIATAALAPTPANATGQDCRLAVSSVTAINLQEAGQDEIWVYLNNRFFPSNQQSTQFTSGQTRTFDELHKPAVTVAAGDQVIVGLLEDDTWPDPNDPLGEAFLGCGGDQIPVMISGSNYQYQIIYTAVIVPHF